MFAQNQTGFEAMVNAFSGDLFRFAYWKCRDRVLAEDLVQETFARAWAGWQQLRDEKAVKSWLFTILHHEHMRILGRRRVEDSDQDIDEALLAVESKVQTRVELRQALWALPASFREPLLLQVIGGFTCAEIGALLSLTEANVMQRVSRARRALRKLLEPGADVDAGSQAERPL